MIQPSIFSAVHWTVSDVTRRVRERLDSDEMLRDTWVDGELSNLSRPASGHIYFTLKDTSAALRCVMWKSDVARQRLAIQEGLAVEVHGHISVYEAGGQYQLYADQVRPIGEGALYQELLQRKSLLEAEGLFNPVRKRRIPEFPQLIGVVTSASGAAWRDILQTLKRRQPLMRVILANSPVQGVDAPPSLIQALASLNRIKPDVILLARGGGSIEDLWAFNDENLVRAVASSEAPVICGVGHETDFTLCDFAADLRAPTPTAGAELASPVTIADLAVYLNDTRSRLNSHVSDLIRKAEEEVRSTFTQLRLVSPAYRLRNDLQKVDELARRTTSANEHYLQLRIVEILNLRKRLQSLSPSAILARGYAILTRKEDGKLVRRVRQASKEMNVRVSDGEFGVIKV